METVKNYFKDLCFSEEGHQYSYKGESVRESVSKIISHFCLPFDVSYYSNKIAIRENKLQEEVLQEWKETNKESIKKGNSIHNFAEAYFYDRSLKPKNKYEEAIVRFFNSLPEHIIPVFSEYKMFHLQYRFAGTADLILYNKDSGKYIIVDYKTNKELDKSYNYLLAPFAFLRDSNFMKYTLQLSLYQMCFEQTGVEVESRKILWLHPSGSFKMRSCKNMGLFLKIWLDENRRIN